MQGVLKLKLKLELKGLIYRGINVRGTEECKRMQGVESWGG